MQELVTAAELQKIGVSPEVLLEKFRVQLIKDFERSNVLDLLKPMQDASFEAIQQNVKEALKNMPDFSFQQLLYTIDVPESKVRDAMRENAEQDAGDVIAELVIKRILQKVILKLVYSK